MSALIMENASMAFASAIKASLELIAHIALVLIIAPIMDHAIKL